VIRTSDHTVTATVPVCCGPRGVAITPDGAFAYVASSGSHNVSVIQTSDNTVVATVTVGVEPISIAIAATGAPCTPTDLADAIAALGPDGDGSLNKGQTDALLRKVAQAVRLTDRGKLAEAETVLEDLRQQIADLEAEGVLTSEQAADLAGCTDDVIAGLGDA
jgi:YVTN family beta-propeller protein